MTQSFRVTIRERIEYGPTFRTMLLKDNVNCFLAGDVEKEKSVLRDIFNASVGFRKLGKMPHESPKSLMPTLSPNGNRQARNLSEIIRFLQKHAGLRLRVRAVR